METGYDASHVAPIAVPVPLLRVRGISPTVWYVAGPAVSVWVHWLPEYKRSMPCVCARCPYCRGGIPRRPLSYVPSYHYRQFSNGNWWSRAVLELPLRAGRELFDRIGKVVSLRRTKTMGPVEVLVMARSEPPRDGVRFEVLPTLFGLWRIPATMQVALVGSGYTE